MRVVAAVIAVCLCAELFGDDERTEEPPTREARRAKTTQWAARLSETDIASFGKRFEREIWPLMVREKGGCASCHGKQNKSSLPILADAETSFRRLLADERFALEQHNALLDRVGSRDAERWMPPEDRKKWSEAEIATLRAFARDLAARQRPDGQPWDEQFPLDLQLAYKGAPSAGADNTFITFYQLRGKTRTIFGDDWRREDKDLFQENIGLFGGADFVRGFHESSKASPTFLTGLDLLARDVASRAYLTRSGPFEGRREKLGDPLKLRAPDRTYRAEINRLYNRLLFRDATEAELHDAFAFIQNVHRDEAKLAEQSQELRFALTATDANGLTTTQDFAIAQSGDGSGLYQEYLDQGDPPDGKIVTRKLGATFHFKANGEGQHFSVSNVGTSGVVTLVGIELRGPLPDPAVAGRRIAVNDPSVQVFGAWQIKDREGVTVFEDNNENKGASSIVIPIPVERDGEYELSVIWRRKDATPELDKRGRPRPVSANAAAVPIEVVSHDPSRHAAPPLPPVPPAGEAHFRVDQTIDNVPHWDLKTIFRFGPDDGVELNNTGTKRTVVADAMHFVDARSGAQFTVRGDEATGNEQWEEFKAGEFKAYNTIGPKLFSDGNQKKGELRMLFQPSVRKEGWKSDSFYRVLAVFPAKVGNETQAPVIVRAQASSPILQISYPRHAHVGGATTLDASASYNLQHTPLQFTWQQISGPAVAFSNLNTAQVAFTPAPLRAQQAAWEGLCRALMHHPDFLFTRPPSLATTHDKRTRARLQLVKMAQDLVGRPPTAAEFKKLDRSASLASLADDYLASQEWRDFYFHRIRLVLESHGSDEDDEPVRLWCYIAFNDRPFQEILTADYTVDKAMQRQPRPAHHGKSGLLTMKGFIKGKAGLPHFNYPAIVAEKFLGYVFEVTPDIINARQNATAASTVDPSSSCYACHKILTPLAHQRLNWDDKGEWRDKDSDGKPLDASDRALVASYPFKGVGMEAFSLQAQRKERFVRTMIQTHFAMFFGREMRYDADERDLYRRLWDSAQASNYAIRPLLRALVTSPEYLNPKSHAAVLSCER